MATLSLISHSQKWGNLFVHKLSPVSRDSLRRAPRGGTRMTGGTPLAERLPGVPLGTATSQEDVPILPSAKSLLTQCRESLGFSLHLWCVAA